MARSKYDGVVEAVHYKPDGEVDWVRAFERRGSTFSDHVLIDRQILIERLKSGKNYMVGTRIPRKGGTFEVTAKLRVTTIEGKDILITGDVHTDRDHLEGVPVL